jgi:hypothetical protein
MTKKVLITGGSGLVGSSLSDKLAERGYEVAHLSRHRSEGSKFPVFIWDLAKSFIEEEAFENVDHIIHLAGAGVTDKRWSEQRKKELKTSRIDSADLILHYLKKKNKKLKAFVSASAIGIYGFDTGAIVQTEDRVQLGDDFLATLTKAWELAADRFEQCASRVVKFRIGPVLSKDGGFLKEILPIAKRGLGSAFGDGEQYMSWIHIDDLVNMFIKAIEDDTLDGVYNAVAPNPVTNKTFLKTLTQTINRPYFLPNTPKLLMRIVFGELSSVITGGNKVSCEKIEKAGFRFQFENLNESLSQLLRN